MTYQDYENIVHQSEYNLDWWHKSIGILKKYDKNPTIFSRENILSLISDKFKDIKEKDIDRLIKYGWTILGSKLIIKL